MYIGRSSQIGNYQICDALSASATDTSALAVSSVAVYPETSFHVICSLNGVIQKPGSSFSISGSNIVFSSALTSSDSIDFILLLGNTLDVGTVSDGVITNAKLAQDIISGETELASAPADTDEFLVSDAGTLKRIDYSLIKSANSPFFQAAMSTAAQTLSDNTAAKVAFNVATYDSGSTYDTSNYRWTPGVVGKYFVSTSVYPSADSDSEMQTTHCTFKKNGTIIHYIGNLDSRTAGYGRGKVCAGSAVIELDADDYVEVFVTVNTVSGGAARVNGETTQTWFNGFKLA